MTVVAAFDGAATNTPAAVATATADVTVNDTSTTPVPTGSVYSLNTGANSVTGTAYDDTFDGAVTNTFNTGDVLAGGGGSDTLVATLSSPMVVANTTSIETYQITLAGATTGAQRAARHQRGG